jgi:hypothetical protein
VRCTQEGGTGEFIPKELSESEIILTRGFRVVNGLNRLLKLSARTTACNTSSSSSANLSFSDPCLGGMTRKVCSPKWQSQVLLVRGANKIRLQANIRMQRGIC